jgi:predicted dehydrogenase
VAADHVTPRIALVGYGRIAPKHVEALRAAGADVVAACNRSEAGRASAASGGIPKTYASIREMLDQERPDGVVCTASFAGIHEAARQILPSGVPTLLEKPPGTSLAELDELIALADTHGTPVVVGLNRRHYGVVRRAVEDAGGFDQITAVAVEWSEDPAHVLQRASAAEVAKLVFANSLHGLDLLTFLAGAVPSPSIVARSLGEPFRWQMALQGVSTRGALATFSSTWDSPGRWRLSFDVPGRRYVFAPLEACTVLERGRPERTIAPPEEDVRYKAGFHRQAEVFLATIRTRTAPTELDLRSARPAMALAQALTDAIVSK